MTNTIVPLTTAQATPFDPTQYTLLEFTVDDISNGALTVLEFLPAFQGMLIGRFSCNIQSSNAVNLICGVAGTPTAANRLYNTVPNIANGSSAAGRGSTYFITFPGGAIQRDIAIYSFLYASGTSGSQITLNGMGNTPDPFDVKFYYRLTSLPDVPMIPTP